MAKCTNLQPYHLRFHVSRFGRRHIRAGAGSIADACRLARPHAPVTPCLLPHTMRSLGPRRPASTARIPIDPLFMSTPHYRIIIINDTRNDRRGSAGADRRLAEYSNKKIEEMVAPPFRRAGMLLRRRHIWLERRRCTHFRASDLLRYPRGFIAAAPSIPSTSSFSTAAVDRGYRRAIPGIR